MLASALALTVGLTGCVSKTAPEPMVDDFKGSVDAAWRLPNIQSPADCVELAAMTGDAASAPEVADILEYADVLRPEQYGYQQMDSTKACTWMSTGNRVRTIFIGTYLPGPYPSETTFTELVTNTVHGGKRPYTVKPDGDLFFASASATLAQESVGVTHVVDGSQVMTIIDESAADDPEALQHTTLSAAQALAVQMRAV